MDPKATDGQHLSPLVVAPQLSPELRLALDRIAAALSDDGRFRREVSQLQELASDDLTRFAWALLELELLRRRNAEARAQVHELAPPLLSTWRQGTAEAWARLHPLLHNLWANTAALLFEFEHHLFNRALKLCWSTREKPAELVKAMEGLGLRSTRRSEFSLCLYHLELARSGLEASRGQFARRAGLLAEAYQDADIAGELVGDDVGLRHLWKELKPYLDEFFETLEEQAARAKEQTRRITIPLPTDGSDIVTDPAISAPKPISVEAPSIASLVVRDEPLASPPVRSRPVRPTAPAPMPRASAPVPLDDADLLIEEATPIPALPRPSGETDVVDLVVEVDSEFTPPPPPSTPAHGIPVTVDAIEEVSALEFEAEPDPATLAFWDYTFASLRVVSEGTRGRMLATDSRADRKRLTTWLDGLHPHLRIPEARAFGSLVRLMLAGSTKETNLFGQPNPRRQEALEAAFSLLTPNPDAAGKVAIWFELDGAETQVALGRGLELMMEFLAFCGAKKLDPLSPATIRKYFAQ